jgi:thiol-disulfide isomerase/thioredoxin
MRALVLLALLAGCPQPHDTIPTPPQSRSLAVIEASPDLDGRLIGTSDARATIVIMMASWCGHCRAEIDILWQLRQEHSRLRIVGVNYKDHEEYDNRGNAQQLRAYLRDHAFWLRVVPAGEAMFDALGRPPFVPAVWVFDANGDLVKFFDRRTQAPPTKPELEALLAQLHA